MMSTLPDFLACTLTEQDIEQIRWDTRQAAKNYQSLSGNVIDNTRHVCSRYLIDVLKDRRVALRPGQRAYVFDPDSERWCVVHFPLRVRPVVKLMHTVYPKLKYTRSHARPLVESLKKTVSIGSEPVIQSPNFYYRKNKWHAGQSPVVPSVIVAVDPYLRPVPSVDRLVESVAGGSVDSFLEARARMFESVDRVFGTGRVMALGGSAGRKILALEKEMFGDNYECFHRSLRPGETVRPDDQLFPTANYTIVSDLPVEGVESFAGEWSEVVPSTAAGRLLALYVEHMLPTMTAVKADARRPGLTFSERVIRQWAEFFDTPDLCGIPVKETYQNFVSFCTVKGIEPLSYRIFLREVRNVMLIDTARRRKAGVRPDYRAKYESDEFVTVWVDF